MSQESSRRRDKLATSSTRIGTNDSMRTLPKVDKKKSKRLMNYEVSQDLYIKDKLKMAEETLVVCTSIELIRLFYLIFHREWKNLKSFGENWSGFLIKCIKDSKVCLLD